MFYKFSISTPEPLVKCFYLFGVYTFSTSFVDNPLGLIIYWQVIIRNKSH